MTNCYLITTFIVLLVGAEAANKAQSGARHLPDQGAAASREGRLAHQNIRRPETRCESSGRPQSLEPSQSGTSTINKARHRCTTTGQMVMSTKPRG
jgi:hypothetical protein